MLTELPHHHNNITKALAACLPSADEIRPVSDLFRQLGDPTCIRLFWLLCHCEECLTDLAALMEMSGPALSHHLRRLKASGLVVSRRAGKEVYYRVSDSRQAKAFHDFIDMMMSMEHFSLKTKES